MINAKFPPIHVFEDVADPDEFEALYELQSLTNPRIQTELGNLALLPLERFHSGFGGASTPQRHSLTLTPTAAAFQMAATA